MRNIVRIVLVVFAVVVLSGCSAAYNCKGVPEGVSCMSARDVYHATDYAESLERSTDESERYPRNYDGDGYRNRKASGTPTPATRTPEPYADERAVHGYSAENPLPIRTPERVMEIWVAPWEDKDGSLHMASAIYTEIEKRRWTVGDSLVDTQAKLQPLEITTRKVDQGASDKNLSNKDVSNPLKGVAR